MSTVWRRLRDDDGISLVEIMVSIVILGIALTAFAGTITNALAVMTQDEQFVSGTQVAADLVEESRAQAWECIGLDSGAPGWTSTASSGAEMVEMDAACTATRVNLPSHEVDLDGQVYDVVREIVWVDAPGVTGTQDHKRIIVTLAWSVRGNAYTTTQESIRVPTPDEVPVSAAPPPPTNCSGRILSTSITPSTVAIDPSGQTAEPLILTVETCEDTSNVTVTGPELSTRIVPATPSGSTTTWELQLNPGVVNFSAGTQTWTFAATGTAPAAERTATEQITFYQDTGLPPVEITAVTVDPVGPWCIEDNGNDKDELRRPITVRISVTGIANGSEGTVTLRWTNPTGTAPVSYDAASGTWVATIPAGTLFTSTGTALYVDATRTVDNEKAAQNATSIAMNRINQNPGCPTS